MKKLCAKQNRRAKQWEFSQSVRNVLRISQCEKPQRISQCEKPQRISQCEKPHCEFGNAKNHSEFRNAKFRNAKNHSEFRNAKLVANLAVNLAMRIFAKVLHFCVRQMNSVLWLENLAMRNLQCEVGKPHFAMPNGCQLIANCLRKFMFCFFSLLIFNICSKICTKLLKLKQ